MLKHIQDPGTGSSDDANIYDLDTFEPFKSIKTINNNEIFTWMTEIGYPWHSIQAKSESEYVQYSSSSLGQMEESGEIQDTAIFITWLVDNHLSLGRM